MTMKKIISASSLDDCIRKIDQVETSLRKCEEDYRQATKRRGFHIYDWAGVYLHFGLLVTRIRENAGVLSLSMLNSDVYNGNPGTLIYATADRLRTISARCDALRTAIESRIAIAADIEVSGLRGFQNEITGVQHLLNKHADFDSAKSKWVYAFCGTQNINLDGTFTVSSKNAYKYLYSRDDANLDNPAYPTDVSNPVFDLYHVITLTGAHMSGAVPNEPAYSMGVTPTSALAEDDDLIVKSDPQLVDILNSGDLIIPVMNFNEHTRFEFVTDTQIWVKVTRHNTGRDNKTFELKSISVCAIPHANQSYIAPPNNLFRVVYGDGNDLLNILGLARRKKVRQRPQKTHDGITRHYQHATPRRY